MKTSQSVNRIRWAVVFCIFLCSSIGTDQARAQAAICIDPGHGGTKPGNVIPWIADFDEKNVNLLVADTLRELFDLLALPPYLPTYIVTREYDTQTVDNVYRAWKADSADVLSFLSIHHNAPLTLDTTIQHTLALYSATPTIQTTGGTWEHEGHVRDTSSLMARKLGYKIDQAFHYGFAGDHPRDMGTSITVLIRTWMPSALTEASFITQPSEAYRFYNNEDRHIYKEAYALLNGWLSWFTGQGIAKVDYEYADVIAPHDVLIEELDFLGSHVYQTPFVGVWGLDEPIAIEAIDFQQDGYTYIFDHWEHRDWTFNTILDTWYQRRWEFNVDYADDSTHWFKAFFKGGPFSLFFERPADTTFEVQKNAPFQISWVAPPGVMESCTLFIDFSSNDGATWTQLLGPVPYNYGEVKNAVGNYIWNTPDISASNCFLRLGAFDYVGNTDTLVSHRFALGCYPPVADFAVDRDYGDIPLEVSFYDISSYEPTSWFWDFGDGATSSLQNPIHTYDTLGLYTVTLIATNVCAADTIVISDLINASCLPIARFDIPSVNLTGPAPFQVGVTNNSQYTPVDSTTYLWDMGDGTTSTSDWGVTHVYQCPGTYTVSLTVTNPCGTDDTVMTDLFVVTDTLGSEWTIKEADGYSAVFKDLCEISDGSIIAVGGGNANDTANILVAKYAECGFADWTKTFNRLSNVDPRAVVPVSAGGILIAGNYDTQVFLLRLDESGDSIWAQQYGDNVVRGLIECSSGGFLTVGWGTPAGASTDRFYALRTDALGNPVWQNYYGPNPGEWYRAGSVIEIDAGRFVIAGMGESVAYAVCIDEHGTVQWSRGYDSGSATDICFTSDSKIAMAINGSGVMLKKLDLTGNVLNSNSFYAEEGITASSIIETKDLGFLISGRADLDDPNLTYVYSGFLLKAHHSCDSLWFDLSTPAATSHLWRSIQLEDGTIRSVGYYSDSAFADTAYASFAKTDAGERIQCCNNFRGNIDYDPGDGIDITDITYLNNYAFKGGPPPPCFEEGDVNGTPPIDIADVVYLVAFVFKGGPAPPSCP